MKVTIEEREIWHSIASVIPTKSDVLVVVPETEFEEQLLTKMYKSGKGYEAFIKKGADTGDVIGLQITTKVIAKEE